MVAEFEKHLSQTLDKIKSQGLYKTERIITTPQDAHIAVADGNRVLNMCANNYLGLAHHPELIKAAKEALDTRGLGMASVRFICGTQDIHKKLEDARNKRDSLQPQISEDTILPYNYTKTTYSMNCREVLTILNFSAGNQRHVQRRQGEMRMPMRRRILEPYL